MHLVTSRVRDRGTDHIQADMPVISEIDDFDSVEEEIKEMEQALEKPPTESMVSAEVIAMSPLLDQFPEQEVFFIDTEQFLAKNKEQQPWRNPDSVGLPEPEDDEL
jgi:hypothetical protein